MSDVRPKSSCAERRSVVLAVSLALCGGLASSSLAAEGRQRIVYSSFASGSLEIWSMAPDGTDAKTLTRTFWDETSPALAPTGDRLAYANNKGEIWVAAPDGSRARKVALAEGFHSQPCWTPDGAKLLVCTRLSALKEEADLYFVDLRPEAGDRARPLTEMPGYETFPCCSPDGRKVVFSHFRIEEEERRLPREPVVEELFMLDVPSGEVRALTRLGKNSTAPCYSPDGKWIAFSSNARGSYDLWFVAANGSGSEPKRVTDDPGYEGAPSWSPDGKRLAFVSSRTGRLEIWSAGRDGKDWRQLTRTPEGRDSTGPSWREVK